MTANLKSINQELLLWNDPASKIDWPETAESTLAAKDAVYITFDS